MIVSTFSTLAQCNDMHIPPKIKRVEYATREFKFSDVTMNGKSTTYLAVKPGEQVKITTLVESRKKGDYCPDCIVQVYWGIHGYVSTCAKSFYGYNFNSKKSSLKFDAPKEAGIYYITFGSTLDYSCKNNEYRPRCGSEHAFAVLKVGNPDPTQQLSLTKINKGGRAYVKSEVIKAGCYGDLTQSEWSFNGTKLNYDNQSEIPLDKPGTYEVVWSNCHTSIAKKIVHDGKGVANNVQTVTKKSNVLVLSAGGGKKDPEPEVEEVEEPTTEGVSLTLVGAEEEPQGEQEPEKDELEEMMENSDKFVLKNLIFDLGKSNITPKAAQELDKMANILRSHPNMRILLEGHTDRRGSAKKNQKLSEERVESAKDYLVEKGINKKRIETQGWGHQKPLVITSDVEEGKINRRVEITILSR